MRGTHGSRGWAAPAACLPFWTRRHGRHPRGTEARTPAGRGTADALLQAATAALLRAAPLPCPAWIVRGAPAWLPPTPQRAASTFGRAVSQYLGHYRGVLRLHCTHQLEKEKHQLARHSWSRWSLACSVSVILRTPARSLLSRTHRHGLGCGCLTDVCRRADRVHVHLSKRFARRRPRRR